MTPKTEQPAPLTDSSQDDTRSSQRACLIETCDGTADRIGEDTTGRPYWYCAECGTEFQTSE